MGIIILAIILFILFVTVDFGGAMKCEVCGEEMVPWDSRKDYCLNKNCEGKK